jgi:Uma2 family endonuclease
MASAAEKLSFADFQRKYGQCERSYEYWNGEAVPKAMPTWIHGLLQAILCRLLWQAGYKSGSEVELRIDPNFCPKPDVIATRGRIETPYPTKAVEVVIEILSPEDSMALVLEKCDTYAKWGFQYVYVVDSRTRRVYQWSGRGLELTDTLATILADQIWSAFDDELV